MARTILKLRVTGAGGTYRVAAETASEQASDDLGPLPDKFTESLASLQEAILRTTESLRDRARAAARGAGADSKGIQEIGTRLFDCVFPRQVFRLYKDTLEQALRKNEELQIKLCVEPPELSYLPWEAMFDKPGLFHLACNLHTPFARVASLQELDLHIYEAPPLRVLCMISAPKDFIGTPLELRTDVEQAALDLALQPLTKAGQVKLSPMASGTFRELKTRIIKGDAGNKWDVFLFIGHGREGAIVFEEDGGSGFELISADVLKGILDAPNGPKLVILNSCKGAQKPEDRLASTAETLVRGGGIAAVVAMQFDISDIMGTAFSPSFFYNLISLDVPIQQAMTLTRLDLQRQGFTEWISPVLYMQNKDGRVQRSNGRPATGGA